MKTIMYLVPHETGANNLPRSELPDQPNLTKLAVRQAEQTRDFLAVRPIDHCYCNPVPGAVQVASIIAAPHGLAPVPLAGLADHALAPATLEDLFARHGGDALLVVSHHDISRGYLAGILGMNPAHSALVRLDNCGISVVIRAGTETTVSMVNAAFHLQGIAA
jgi:broad specificity phosphatase PhoE